MTDLKDVLRGLQRPRMLVGAARRGLGQYRRETDLPRLVPNGADRAAATSVLLADEATLEAKRTAGDVTYSIARHIMVLTALLAEAQLALVTL